MWAYSNESMEAKVFVEFVALIIRNRIYTYLKQEQRDEAKLPDGPCSTAGAGKDRDDQDVEQRLLFQLRD